MSWQKYMLRYATPEQRATIERLSGKIIWQTSFHDWIETRFGQKQTIEARGGAQLVIDALKSKLRNQKRPVIASDPERPATAEQIAAIERLSKEIRWDTGFNEWLRKKCGLKQVGRYSQAERVIHGLKDKLKAQLLGHDTNRADETQRGSRQDCARSR
jgi:hypothetical protein